MRHSLTAKSSLASVVLAFCVAFCPVRAGPQRTQAGDLRSLLVAAINAPDGQASGELVGEIPSAISQRFRSRAPLRVDVTTLRRFKQTGCSRLNVKFSQNDVLLPGAPVPQARTLDVGLNYCLDGNPPESLD